MKKLFLIQDAKDVEALNDFIQESGEIIRFDKRAVSGDTLIYVTDGKGKDAPSKYSGPAYTGRDAMTA